MQKSLTKEQAIIFLTRQEDGKKWDITEHKEKRSLDSNAYFHVLCDKLRQAAGVSFAACKNNLITSYGQIMYIEDGEPMIYKTNAPPEYVRELEEIHLKLVKTAIDNDKDVYFYRMYRGSHTYNSSEMNELIKGTIQDCLQYEIEVATPNELLRMQELWRGKYERQHNR